MEVSSGMSRNAVMVMQYLYLLLCPTVQRSSLFISYRGGSVIIWNSSLFCKKMIYSLPPLKFALLLKHYSSKICLLI